MCLYEAIIKFRPGLERCTLWSLLNHCHLRSELSNNAVQQCP
jgi:hypothetical protein